MKEFSAALIQMDLVHKDPEANRARAEALVRRAAGTGAGLVVLPETWTSGYSEAVFGEVEKYAEPEGGPSLQLMRNLAREYGVHLVAGSIAESEGSRCYNLANLIDPAGRIIGKYRKMHLYSAMGEDIAFGHGEDMPVFETELGELALMTCYDIRFPELARSYALRGAEMIVVVSNFPAPRVNHWRILLQARAIENQLFVLACNRVGSTETSSYFGHSLIIDPWGEIQAEGGEAEEIVCGKVLPGKLSEVRSRIPVFKDRRPQSYPGDC